MKNTVGKKHFPEACKTLNALQVLIKDSKTVPFLSQTYKESGLATKSTGASRTQQEIPNTRNEQWDCQPPTGIPECPHSSGGSGAPCISESYPQWPVSNTEPAACLTQRRAEQGASMHLGSAEQTPPLHRFVQQWGCHSSTAGQ